ncbi:ABC transporter ATP-binding protein C-terminal domain-containing protein [Aquamicrobium terrae]
MLIDEPAAGMSDGECVELTALLRQIPTRFGAAVVLVEHNVRMVAEVCQSVHVLDRGQSIAHGTPGQVLSDPIVIQAYLGSATE